MSTNRGGCKLLREIESNRAGVKRGLTDARHGGGGEAVEFTMFKRCGLWQKPPAIMEFEVNIGLETHVQLKTKSKMWCGCPNQFGSEPNTNVCPVCLGLPGVLPVANEEALRLTVLTGCLLYSQIPPHAVFDRKNYFYPDVAKNYQLTQLGFPSTLGGHVDFEFEGRVQRVHITRAHLEEDVGKNNHFDRQSGVDFNRAGVPLLEIVSEPQLTSADMTYAYLEELKDILKKGEVSECDMEKGMVRCDVNVSVRPKGQKELGAKIEIKNMNSFSGVRRALQYEIPRQIEAVTSGEQLRQETRRWDDLSGMTEVMRSKEHAHDYRYFPEPDLMPFEPSDELRKWAETRASAVRRIFRTSRVDSFKTYSTLDPEALSKISGSRGYGDLVEFIFASGDSGKPIPKDLQKPVVNIVTGYYGQFFNARGLVLEQAKQNGDVISLYTMSKTGSETVYNIPSSGTYQIADALYGQKTINNSAALCVAEEMIESGKDPKKVGKAPPEIILELGLAQVSDTGALEQFCDEAIAAHPGPAADFRAGKVAALNFLKGQVMKLSKGKANPALVGELLEKKLQS